MNAIADRQRVDRDRDPIESGRERLTAFLTDDTSERVVRQTVGEMALPFSTVIRGGIEKAIAHLQSVRSPTALIVDVSGVELPVSEVNRLAEVCEPGVAVTIVGDRNDVGLYRDLLQAGVTDYLVKPLTRSLVQGAIGTLLGDSIERFEPLSRKLGHVVSVIGARGGVGTTTVATNLAWLLANQAFRRVVFIDLDLSFGDAALMYDLKTVAGLRDVLENPQRVDELFLERAMVRSGERLFLLAANEPLDARIQIDPKGIGTLLEMLQKQFHYVIVDLPRRENTTIKQVMELANTRVVVTDLTAHSIRDTVKFRKLLDAPRPGQRNLIVMNRAGEAGKTGIDEKFLADTIGMPVDVIVPYDAKSVIMSGNSGSLVASKTTPVGLAMRRIAAQLSGNREVPKKGWRGLFKK